jgi:hypothetical protein
MSLTPWLSFADEPAKGTRKKLLFFTRSQGHPHDAVTRKTPDELAYGEKLFKQWGEECGYDITVSKDGRIFDPGAIDQWDAFAFYTTGDEKQLKGTKEKSDTTPPMSPAGKEALLKAVAAGKGFLGLHSATDTFLSQSHDSVILPAGAKDVDPYIQMIGGEFVGHGKQQKATLRVADSTFPGLVGLKDVEQLNEEWYSINNISPDLHVILVQDTTTMADDKGQRQKEYQREPYPQTWARMHGKGRVFYTSMGHRQDVWNSALYKQIVVAGLKWICGDVQADITPNLKRACPKLG